MRVPVVCPSGAPWGDPEVFPRLAVVGCEGEYRGEATTVFVRVRLSDFCYETFGKGDHSYRGGACGWSYAHGPHRGLP